MKSRIKFLLSVFVSCVSSYLFIPQISIASELQGNNISDFVSFIPQAPESQAMARAIDIPVNHYSGRPNIAIPLYEINYGGLSIPITLSYNASGILANQEATAIGLGWELNAGGIITRTIKCMDDLKSGNGYFSYQNDWDGSLSTVTDYFDITNQVARLDLEPDLFFYSTPFESGKFYFDHEGTAHFVDRSTNAKLHHTTNQIEIIDSKGIKYIYANKETTMSFGRSGKSDVVNSSPRGYDVDFGRSSYAGYSNSEEYVSSWKLSTIVTPVNDTIHFKYVEEKYQLPIQETATCQTLIHMDVYPYDRNVEPNGFIYNVSKTVISGWRLSRIEWPGGMLTLETKKRDDIKAQAGNNPPPHHYTSLKVTDLYSGETCKEWVFDHSYFNENHDSIEYPHLYKRLKLLSVANVAENNKGYSFTYYEDYDLPAKNTKNTDYWGYYNGKNQGSVFVCGAVYNGQHFAGGNKNPDIKFSRLGTLKTITHPTGGTTRFTFESNSFYQSGFEEDIEVIHNTCAARCEREPYSNKDSIVSDTIEIPFEQRVTLTASAYNQEDATTYNLPNKLAAFRHYAFEFYSLSESGESRLIKAIDMPSTWDFNNDFEEVVDTLLVPGKYILRTECLLDSFAVYLSLKYKGTEYHPAGERECGGLRVAKIEGEKTITYQYEGGIQFVLPSNYSFKRINDVVPVWGGLGNEATYFVQHSESARSLSSLGNGMIVGYSEVYEKYNDMSYNYYEFHNEPENELLENYPMAGTQTEWLNGKPLLTENVDTKQMPRQTTQYYYCFGDTSVIKGHVSGINRCVSDESALLHQYSNYVCQPLLEKVITNKKYTNGELCAIKRFTYDKHFQCVSEKESSVIGSKETLYRYSYDFADTVSKKMTELNMINEPLAIINKRNTTICDGRYSQYRVYGGRLLPYSVSQLDTDHASETIGNCTFKDIIKYVSYNKYNNVQQVNCLGMDIVYLWGYKGRYPIAEIKNATLTEVSNVLSNARITELADKATITQEDLDNLRSALLAALPNSAITTYKFAPLVGVTAITDASGILSRYNYDKAGRLESVIFGASDTIQTYAYHYADIEDSLNYVVSKRYLDKAFSNSTDKIQYYDEWGRSTLSADQGRNTDGTYTYYLQTYDMLGRPSRSWATLPTSDIEPQRRTEEQYHSLSYEVYGNDSCSYSQTYYDVFGNAIKETFPGASWQDNNKFSSVEYRTNDAGEVKHYLYKNDALSIDSLEYYKSGSLTCVVKTDPDGNTVKTYQDLWGNTVLERKDSLDTYYVYDDYNRLRSVLSPKYQDDETADLRYEYHYDGQGRIDWKKIPGHGKVAYLHDTSNRIIAMQDEQLREKALIRRYSYDGLGRLLTQFVHSRDTVEEIKNYYDTYTSLPQEIRSLYPDIDFDNLETEGFGRNNLIASWQNTSENTPRITMFAYDEHGRIRKSSECYSGKKVDTENTYNYCGDLESSSTAIHATDMQHLFCSVSVNNIYDFPNSTLLHKRIMTVTDNAGRQSRDTTLMRYNQWGRISEIDRQGCHSDVLYSYDNLHGWLKSIRADSEGGFRQTLFRESGSPNPRWNGSISSMEWQMPGELVKRRYDYEYDGQNRLKKAVYSEPFFVGGGRDTLVDAFNPGTGTLLRLVPSASVASVSPTGISQMEESVNLPILPPIERPNTTTNKYGEEIQYDKNSNITHIRRYGARNDRTYGLIDDVEITYNGNQRDAATDNIANLTYAGASEFVRHGTGTYAYDRNGALCRDENRGIDSIEYDLLGNLKKIQFTGERSIEYVYSASGEKLREIHKRPRTYIRLQHASGGTISPDLNVFICDTTDYLGPLILRNGHPEMLRFDGGYISFVNDTISGIHYYIQDYMGNNRMVVNGRTDSIEQVTHYYPYGGIIGDISTNESLQKFKFEGKELDRTFGLDNYDIHARQYFAMAPMWDRIDPLAPGFPGISPYAYCSGDPVNRGDYDGKFTIWINGQSTEENRGRNSYWDKGRITSIIAKRHDECPELQFRFYDGSMGGWDNTLNFGSNDNRWNLICKNRISAGYIRGVEDARSIILSLKRDSNGKISEVIRIIAHSMGAAYAKGLVRAIIEYANEFPEECEGLSIAEYDFAAFQYADQTAIENVDTFQYAHVGDMVASYGKEQGVPDNHYFLSIDGDHKIESFTQLFYSLPEGKYIYVDGKWELQK